MDPTILSDLLEQYCTDHSTPPDETLLAIDHYSNLNTTKPQMVSGAWQGSLLQILSLMLAPSYVVELGTFTGYSAICLARGLKADGKLVTIESDAEMISKTKDLLADTPELSKIQFRHGEALALIPDLDDEIDLIFIDAKKDEYLKYYEALLPKLKHGGVMLVDNILWYGKVLHDEKDKVAAHLDEVNKAITADDRVTNCLIPIRDGLMMVRKL